MDKTTTSNAVRHSFSPLNAKHQLAWDSTSLGALKRCPQYYEYNIINGYVTRAENAHLRWGSEYNNALVTYHKLRAQGQDKDDALLGALRYALEHTWDYALGRPWTSDEPTKTRETLIRSVIWYLDQFKDDSLETLVLANGEAAVELPFRINLEMESSITGEGYMLCGYLDRKVEFNGPWITDWKSTKYQLDEKYFEKYSPDNQVSQYSLAGSIIGHAPIKGVIIDAVQLGVTFSRFQRGQIPRTPQVLEEWLDDAMTFIRQNEAYVERNHWPKNDVSCHLYGGCTYRKICSAIPELRPRLLEGLFHKRIWDPLVVREI
jgi:PD-(D/E)XK nuclease superfamily